MLQKYQAYIDALRNIFGKRWMFCGVCYKAVRFDMTTTQDELVGDTTKGVTRRPECGVPWFIQEKEEIWR